MAMPIKVNPNQRSPNKDLPESLLVEAIEPAQYEAIERATNRQAKSLLYGPPLDKAQVN